MHLQQDSWTWRATRRSRQECRCGGRETKGWRRSSPAHIRVGGNEEPIAVSASYRHLSFVLFLFSVALLLEQWGTPWRSCQYLNVYNSTRLFAFQPYKTFGKHCDKVCTKLYDIHMLDSSPFLFNFETRSSLHCTIRVDKKAFRDVWAGSFTQ